MTVGYIHMGEASHGVCRYGRLLAAAVRAHQPGRVVEAACVLPEDAGRHADALDAALAAMAPADVVHVQYNPRVWGGAHAARRNVQYLAAHLHAPYVVTLHDVRDGYGPWGMLRRLWAQRASGRQRRQRVADASGTTASARTVVDAWRASAGKALDFLHREYDNARATRDIARSAAEVLVCTAEEARRAEALMPRPTVIPHFVERIDVPEAKAAKAALGLEDYRVCTVLGYIHRRKGHDRLIAALPHLPEDVMVVCAGAPGKNSPAFAKHLRAQAAALGCAGRLRITGYVPDDVLRQYLAATDVAACPFREASASGSLATWIATGRPIVTSRLPLFLAYNAHVEGALRIADASRPQALAQAIRRTLEAPAAGAAARAQLQDELSLAATAAKHQACYRRVTA
ncbi:glycosyltransferase [Salisaeta longa]|uniref:glycosyltransferase n=1 Tax=Salisaeta longa TaxID=503170 RepID=UPI0003B6EAD7|nr:glycosyltransferase [Salisaeta longa]